jgi:hypothetical protein
VDVAPLLPLVDVVALAWAGPERPPPWRFEPTPVLGDIRVAPVIALHEAPALVVDTWLGLPLPLDLRDTRRDRTAQLGSLPHRAGIEVPGALNAAFGRDWDGRFRLARFPPGGETRLEAALRGVGDVDTALSHIGRAMGGDGALFTWVDRIEGAPLTASRIPGDLVDTAAGPVVVDFRDEPYLVSARMGVALVAPDGEVVLRYRQDVETVLSGRLGPVRAGRALADALAAEVARVWVLDPRLQGYAGAIGPG